MSEVPKIRWPRSLCEIARTAEGLEEFGRLLREWEHHISREGVHSRPALARSLAAEPPILAERFDKGEVADAYLAALAEWLALKNGFPPPGWTADPKRVAEPAWWAHGHHNHLLVHAPASFRTRNLFTIPHDPFRPRAGRPRVDEETKRRKGRARQKRYRQRIGELVRRAREQEREVP